MPGGTAERIREVVAEALPGGIRSIDVRLDVDVLSESDSVIEGRPLDSLDVVHIFAVIEDVFGLALTDLPDVVDSLTLRDLAELIDTRVH